MKKRNLLILRRHVQLPLTEAVPVRPICRLAPSWIDYVRVIFDHSKVVRYVSDQPIFMPA